MWRVLIAVSTTLGVLALLVLLFYGVDMLLLVFAGVLLAVLLRAPANMLAAHSPLTAGWSVAVVIFGLSLLLWGTGELIASRLLDQYETLSTSAPQMVENVKQQLLRYPWGERLVEQAQSITWDSPRMNVLGRMRGALSTAFGVLANVAIIAFLGLYFAAQPDPYLRGLIQLVPVSGRHRAREVLQGIGQTLQWWLLGTLSSMVVVGVLTWLGLLLLGIPLALVLALMAGLFSFVPYLGPIASAVPAVLIAFTESPQQALYVALLYLAIQLVESYLITPLIQQQAVELPAAMILFAQLMLGFILGGMGVVLATPLAAVILVLVKMLYIEDILGDTEGAG